MNDYDWDSIVAVHRYFCHSKISYQFLTKYRIETSFESPFEVTTCFGVYWEVTSQPFKKENLDSEILNTDLNYFFLRGLNLDEISVLQNFPNLHIVDCESGNSIDSLVPLKNLFNLKELYFSGNKINNLAPLSQLEKLEVLDLSNNALVNVKELSRLVNLKKLYLDTNQINDISAISNLRLLEELDISRNVISDISCLCNLKKLKVLRLNQNYLNEKKIIELGKQIKSCKIYFELTEFKSGYLFIKDLDNVDVAFLISDSFKNNVGHCCVSLLDNNFTSKRDMIDEMRQICRQVVERSNRENYTIRELKREHFFDESADYVRAQFDY